MWDMHACLEWSSFSLMCSSCADLRHLAQDIYSIYIGEYVWSCFRLPHFYIHIYSTFIKFMLAQFAARRIILLRLILTEHSKNMARKRQPPSIVDFLVIAGQQVFLFEIVHRTTDFPASVYRRPILPYVETLEHQRSLAVLNNSGLFRNSLLDFTIRILLILFQPILALVAKEEQTLESAALLTRPDLLILFDR